MTHPLINEAKPVDDSTASNGAANAAQITLGAVRGDFDVFVDTSGAATLTVEVSTDGSTWREFDTVSYGSATVAVEQYDTAYPRVRAYLDTATNTVEVASKGLE